MQNLHGIIPPVVTPLLDRSALDQTGLERLLQHIAQGGVNALFVLGTTGEAPSLSYKLRREVIQFSCQNTPSALPVLVGITDTAFDETVALAKTAADHGASALVLAMPYYFPAGQTELLDYIRHLLPELPLPLMLYNMPAMTKVRFELDTLQQLTQEPKIIGIKDSSGDLEYYKSILSLRTTRPDWTFFMGPEELLIQSVQLGGDGGVNGGANIFPTLFTQAYQAAKLRNTSQCDQLQSLIQSWHRAYQIGKYPSRFIKATKCALSILNICSDFMAEPFHRFNPPERQQIQNILKELLPQITNLNQPE
ncbi:MAG: dihydrodipicolinate synthase family protein [Limisphaerales bacterium]|jgi:dihydrodipicolinate synthase/N-acetylneuraminate lyase